MASTVIQAGVVDKLAILVIKCSISFISGLSVVLVGKLVIAGVLSSLFLILALYTSFLTTSVFYYTT